MAIDVMKSVAEATWNLLLGNDIIGAVLFPYINLIGSMFYVIFVLLGLTMIYLKTKDFVTVGITALLLAGGGIYLWLPQNIYYISWILLALALAIAMYRLFR